MAIAGCYWLDPLSRQPKYLRQVRLDAHTSILSSISRTTLTQTFINSSGDLPELQYSFPLFDGVSVVGFTCTIGERVIKGVVKEKHQAQQVYTEAVARGETAGLLEQLAAASDVFTTTIGNVATGAEIKVEITYLGELKHDAQVDGIRLTIPTSIAPRYGSFPSELKTSQFQANGGIKITVDAEVPDGSNITSIQSPSHQLAVKLGVISTALDAKPSFQKASATLSLGTAELEKDFVLQVKATNTGNPTAILEEHPTIPHQRALMATLVPKFKLPPEQPEIVFVCDRSGSMEGKIKNLKAALRLFVKSLSVGVKFNICSFGFKHTFLWERSRSYDKASVDEAMRHIETFSADYGGTEMFEPIEDSFKRRYSDMNLEVFLLTDGEIWDQGELINMINEHVSSSKGAIRLFSLGIGRDVSHALIESVARAGNGFSQSVTDDEEMGSKIVRMLKGALYPHITDYSLELEYASSHEDSDGDFEVIEKADDDLTKGSSVPSTATLLEDVPKATISLFDPSVDLDATTKESTIEERHAYLPRVDPPKLLQTPFEIPPLFPFNRTTVYLLLSPETTKQTPKSVILRGTSIHGPLELKIPITVLEKKGETIHQLAAKKAVGELEQGRGWIYHARTKETDQLLKDEHQGRFQDMVEREAVRLGVQYQVGGKWCSFVAVQENDAEKEQTVHVGITQEKTPFSRYSPRSASVYIGPGDMVSNTGVVVENSASWGQYDMLQQSATALARRTSSPMKKLSQMATGSFSSLLSKKTKKSAASTQKLQQHQMPSPAPMPQAGALNVGGFGSSLMTKGSQPPAKPGKVGTAGFFGNSANSEEAPRIADDLPADKLQALVILQHFEGYWVWDEKFQDLMNWNKADVAHLVDNLEEAHADNILATAYVIAWLEKKMAEEKDTWELLADKAQAWLEGKVGENLTADIIHDVGLTLK